MTVTPIPRRPEDVLADLRALAAPGRWERALKEPPNLHTNRFVGPRLNDADRRTVEDAIALIESLLDIRFCHRDGCPGHVTAPR